MGAYTNNYQAIAGQRALLSEAYAMTNPIILMGVTATPAYGGEPSTVSVNIISQKKVLNLIGQQDTETFKVDFIPDWTATTGNYDIIKANQKLDDIADKIKKLDLSPAEQLLMAYFEVTGIPYQEESEDENKNISRAIYSILNSDKIVCVGYVELLKEIMARVNKDNVVMFENCLMLNENGTDYSHMTAIVYLKDEKYNLNGYYYIDPTSDTKRKDEPNKFALASFLVPLGMLRYSFNELKSDEMTEKRGIAQFMNALDSNTKLSYNYIKDMPSSVVDEDARPNKRLFN